MNYRNKSGRHIESQRKLSARLVTFSRSRSPERTSAPFSTLDPGFVRILNLVLSYALYLIKMLSPWHFPIHCTLCSLTNITRGCLETVLKTRKVSTSPVLRLAPFETSKA
jgi:hypothetical protein